MNLGLEDSVLNDMEPMREPKRPTRREFFKREIRPSGGCSGIPRRAETVTDAGPQEVGDKPQPLPSADLGDDIDIPKDATDEELEVYDLALSYWRDCMDEYEVQEDGPRYLKEYMLENVSLDLREKCFDPEHSLAEWYYLLEDNVGA